MNIVNHAYIREISEIVMGQAPPGSDCNKNGIGTIFVKAGEFDERQPFIREWTTNPLKLAYFGDVLVCVVGATAGKINESINCAIGRSVAAIRPNNTILSSQYLFQFLQTKVLWMRAKSQGLAQGVITRDMLSNLEIPLPPLTDQRRIAEILDKAEDLRAKRRAALAQLDTLTQSIFLEMFGNPVTNPKGWQIRTLGLEIESVRYGTGSPPNYVEKGVPFIRATNIKDCSISPKDLVYISTQDAERIPKCKTYYGDLIVVRSGVNTGDCAIVPREYDGSYAAYDLIVKLSIENAVFYSFLINSPYGKQCLSPLTRRAALPHLNADQLRNLKFIAPPINEKKEFASRINTIEKLKTKYRISLKRMDELFCSLQYRAFRGEL